MTRSRELLTRLYESSAAVFFSLSLPSTIAPIIIAFVICGLFFFLSWFSLSQSTILKQIKIIHGVPFEKADEEAVRESLRTNTMTAMHSLLDAVVRLKVKVDSTSQALVRKLADYPQSEPVRLCTALRCSNSLTRAHVRKTTLNCRWMPTLRNLWSTFGLASQLRRLGSVVANSGTWTTPSTTLKTRFDLQPSETIRVLLLCYLQSHF